ncbi:Galactose transporter [Lachnellula hyalina]|uniref:Galactose transporter n=1 Tax=Lachnellula hyalina TaxID=1316788 RepID=A0A8H8QXY8_9HELO|nr:Galactose transporter [Lachnellula hyalina]TVY24779.1 Galactose transporter [Lachnellula hyalina]
MLNINFHEHKWALFYCAISTCGALCYGYDQIYYTGIQGMTPFIDVYGTKNSSGTAALTTSFLSLTASIIYVGELLGALLAAPINDHLGRKAVFLCASLCIIAGAVVQVADNGSEGLIILGRILIGLGIGQFTVTCVLYIGEIAPKAIRGPALMTFQLMQSCSQLVGSGVTQGTESLKSTAAFRIPMGLLALLPLLMMASLPFLPESPVWLMRKGRIEQAERSLQKIHKSTKNYEATMDIHILEEEVAKEKEAEATSTWVSLIRDPIERRKLIFACGAMIAQQINGIQFFYSYGVVFAQSIGISQPFTISLITNVLQVVAVAVSVALGNKVPRRINLLVTTVMMFFAFIIIGGFGTRKELTTGFSTAIVVFSYIVIVAFNFGLGPLAFAMASECSAGRNRNKIMSCAIVSFFLTVWVIAFTSPYLYYSANLGPMLGFVYAGSTCITLLYVWFCVGETTGRSNLEIEILFQEKVPVRQWKTHTFAVPITSVCEDEAKIAMESGLTEVEHC